MSLNNRCDSYKIEQDGPHCWGVKDRPECNCNGDKTLCEFYPEVKEKAIETYQHEDTAKILKEFGVLDNNGKLSEVYRNIYELRKKQLTGNKSHTDWSKIVSVVEIAGMPFEVLNWHCKSCDFKIPTSYVSGDYKYCPKCGNEITYITETKDV